MHYLGNQKKIRKEREEQTRKTNLMQEYNSGVKITRLKTPSVIC